MSQYLLLASGGGGGAPIAAPLTQRHGVLYDRNGPRIVQGFSDFPGLRILHDNPTETYRTLDAGTRAGRQYVYSFYGLAENEIDYNGFWQGAMVLPDLAREMMIPYADACANRRLGLMLTGGHNFGGDWSKEKAFIQWMAQALKDADHAETITAFAWRSEYPITSPYGSDSPETYAHGFEACQIMKDALGCLVSLGAPGEDDDAIARSVEFTDFASIDFSRLPDGAQLMKRAHRAYYDGRYHGKYQTHGPRALIVTEPEGPNAPGHPFPDGVLGPLDDPAYIYGLHAIYAVTGQGCNYFNGPAIRHRLPIDSTWGFYELPALLKFIPEDIGEWLGPTWFVKGNQFCTVAAESWRQFEDPDPNIKIQTWTVQFYDGSTMSGTGNITLKPGWKACIAKGTWLT